MKRKVVIYLSVAISILTTSTALAHHSHALFYDSCKRITIEGRIENVEWRNPHVHVVVKMDDGTSYTAELTSPDNLTKQGIAGAVQAALTVGARIVVVGNPLRDPAQIRASFPNITNISNTKLVDVNQIRRQDNSWSWSQTTPECK